MPGSLPQYNPDAKCVACGSDRIKDRYVREVLRTRQFGEVDNSHIRRSCFGCKYTWQERPLYFDKGPAAPSK